MAIVRLLARSSGPILGRGMVQPGRCCCEPVPLEQHVVAEEGQGQGGQGQRQAAEPEGGQGHDHAEQAR